MEVGTWRDGRKPIVRMMNKLLIFALAGAGGIGGFAFADAFYSRRDTPQLVLAVAGIALGVLVWWPVNRWLSKLL